MTQFVHVNMPKSHPGVARFEVALNQASSFKRQISSTRSMAALLFTAMLAALLVVGALVAFYLLAKQGALVQWAVLVAGLAAAGIPAAPLEPPAAPLPAPGADCRPPRAARTAGLVAQV